MDGDASLLGLSRGDARVGGNFIIYTIVVVIVVIFNRTGTHIWKGQVLYKYVNL